MVENSKFGPHPEVGDDNHSQRNRELSQALCNMDERYALLRKQLLLQCHRLELLGHNPTAQKHHNQYCHHGALQVLLLRLKVARTWFADRFVCLVILRSYEWFKEIPLKAGRLVINHVQKRTIVPVFFVFDPFEWLLGHLVISSLRWGSVCTCNLLIGTQSAIALTPRDVAPRLYWKAKGNCLLHSLWRQDWVDSRWGLVLLATQNLKIFL